MCVCVFLLRILYVSLFVLFLVYTRVCGQKDYNVLFYSSSYSSRDDFEFQVDLLDEQNLILTKHLLVRYGTSSTLRRRRRQDKHQRLMRRSKPVWLECLVLLVSGGWPVSLSIWYVDTGLLRYV